MQPLVPPASVASTASTSREEAIRHLPADIQLAFRKFETDGDVAALDSVILAILDDYIPKPSARPLSELPGDTRLMDDLGFDSLAITEVVFFTEDLLGISIANEEIIQVSTLDDLRGFVRRKVSARAAG